MNLLSSIVAATLLAAGCTAASDEGLAANTTRNLAFARRTCVYGLMSYNFVGGDVANTNGNSGSCTQACLQHPLCTAHTWSDYNGGTCWLKNPAEYIATYEEGSISTFVRSLYVDSCPPIRIIWQNRDFQGDDIANAKGSDVVDCYAQCRGISGCWAYTWSNYNGGWCWFKNANALKLAKTMYAAGKNSGIIAQTKEVS